MSERKKIIFIDRLPWERQYQGETKSRKKRKKVTEIDDVESGLFTKSELKAAEDLNVPPAILRGGG